MTATTHDARAGDGRIPLSAADAEYISREFGVRVTAVRDAD